MQNRFGVKYYNSTSFGTHFGCQEYLAANIWVMLYVHSLKFSTIFLLLNVFINIHEYSN